MKKNKRNKKDWVVQMKMKKWQIYFNLNKENIELNLYSLLIQYLFNLFLSIWFDLKFLNKWEKLLIRSSALIVNIAYLLKFSWLNSNH